MKQAYADKISSYFVPVVIALAFSTFLFWIILGAEGGVPLTYVPDGSNPFLMALLFSISVVVIACPCALGLATPTAVMVGTGVGAQLGEYAELFCEQIDAGMAVLLFGL